MTTRLRLIGASFMGILDPVPFTTPSAMNEAEGAWVQAHAWTDGLRRIENAYPHGFHRWCSCERGTCTACASDRRDRCISAKGPRIDTDAGTITDRKGFVVAVIHHGPRQRPCRWTCPCSHPAPTTDATPTAPKAPAPEIPEPGRARSGGAERQAHEEAGQTALF
ncbi:DUF6248 family natural product biosynthesis protein [Streptomyces sp. NPDC006692]|uniref:DUF6248 family natural product biosynthesis protein n=1 Tax=unclassified Streptomyces TaxID=2593676 RepID=UPI0036933527